MPIVLKSRAFDLLETSGPVQACNGIALPLPIFQRLLFFKTLQLDDGGLISRSPVRSAGELFWMLKVKEPKPRVTLPVYWLAVRQ